MRIAHICPYCFTDGYTYQENLLARQHHLDGHEVLVVASTERLNSRDELEQSECGRSLSADGFAIQRLPHVPYLPISVAQKVRWMPGLDRVLEDFRPDAAVFHGPQSLSLLAFRDFQRRHAETRCYVDCHSDPYSTGRTLLSRALLHRLFYRWIVRSAFPELGPLLCISLDVQRFVKRHYGLGEEDCEFYPLGGFPHSDEKFGTLRAKGRAWLGVDPSCILMVQTGKMDRHKRLEQTLRAFRDCALPNAVLAIAGSMPEDVRKACGPLIQADPRVRFLGWLDAERLFELLCACDVYVQPGAQSATMQLALCSRCPVVLRDVPSHAPFVRGNGWLVRSESELREALQCISQDPARLASMSLRSLEIARELLDYRVLGDRVLWPRQPRQPRTGRSDA